MSSTADFQIVSSPGLHTLHTESVMIIVDYDNLIRSFKDSIPGIKGAYIDFGLMKSLLANDRYVIEARAYSGFIEGCPIPNGLLNMDNSGFKLYLEPVINGRQKGVDMSIGMDALECARQKVCDTIILVTGDGDLAPAVRRIKSYGVRVQVASFASALNDNLGDEADETIILDNLRMVDICGIKTAN